MPDIFRSFRFFGNFELVRVRTSENLGKTGFDLLEFFHARHPVNETYCTFARFSKLDDGLPVTPHESPEVSENIFDSDATDRLLGRLQTEQEPVSFWVCKPENGKGGRTVKIRNAICMDQFNNPGSETPTQRFPLCSAFSFGAKTYQSSITLGHGDKNRLFDIRMALGFPQLWSGSKNGPALVTGGVFRTDADAPEKFTLPHTMLAGPREVNDTKKQAEIDSQFRFGDYIVADESGLSGVDSIPFKPRLNKPDLTPFTRAIGLDAKIKYGKAWVQMRSAEDKNGNFVFSMAYSQKFTPNSQSLDFTKQLGAVLPLKAFTAEVYWQVSLTNADIMAALRGNPTELEVVTATQIRWEDNTGSGLSKFHEDGELPAGGLVEINRMSKNTRAGLTATDRQPQSILPEFTNLGNVAVPLLAYPRDVVMHFSLGKAPEFQAQTQPRFGITLDTDTLDKSRKVHAMGENWLYNPSVAKPVKLNMRLPAFNDYQQANGDSHHHILLAHNTASQQGGGISMRIGNDTHANEVPFSARLGSLEFSGEKYHLLADGDSSLLTIHRRKRNGIDGRASGAPALDVTWQLNFGIAMAKPVAVDIPHGQRFERESDMLISEDPVQPKNPGNGHEEVETGSVSKPPFNLLVTEHLRDDQDRHLVAELLDHSSDETASQVYTVIGQAPYFAYRFIRAPLSGSGDDEGAGVAHFDSDLREWQLKRPSDTYMMIRPPGATGEDADKPGRLEIHDAPDRNAPIRPALASDQGVLRKRVVNMRLSPNTNLWVEPSGLARNYYLPEYAGRELFRQQGDFGIGMAISGLRTELVYGLSTGLSLPLPTAARPAPRIAELGALTGKPVHINVATDAKTAKRWEYLHPGLRHRPERLEIWSLDPAKQNPFVPARFEEGLTFSLRNTALTAPPIDSELSYPVISKQPEVRPLRFDKRGLAGGAIWPVESANVARYLAAHPVASGGALEKVALSPLGDSGDQTVRFGNNYVSIITETREGRLQKHRVEVMGRISALWHRAKHVVIYERTTASSAQFTPESQTSRSRRPILRKVDEFIEILEPSRRYPDTPDAGNRSRGFLEEVRFNSKIIRVNSAWGRDVGDFGWEVPLWDRHEAATRPQVYPYPDVAFITSAEGATDTAQATHDCLDVANLYFYTDPKAAEDAGSSDKWPARQGVDFSVLGHPDTLNNLLSQLDVQQSDKSRRTAASRLIPGLGRFSWRLSPSPVRTRLNEGRGQKPVFAGIESVSLMRGAGAANADAKKAVGDVIGLRNTLVTPAEIVGDKIALPLATQGISSAIDAIRLKNVAEVTSDDISTLKAALTGFDAASVKQKINSEIPTDWFPKHDLVNKVLDYDAVDCNSIGQSAAAMVRNRKMLILQMVAQAESEVIDWLRNNKNPKKDEVKAKLREAIERATQNIFEQASTGFGDVLGGVANARAVVADWRADAIAGQTRAQARIANLRQSYDVNKPWSRNRIEKVLKNLQGEFDGARDEALAALDEARLRMAAELESASQSAGSRITAAISMALQANALGQKQVGTVSAALDSGAGSLKNVIGKLPTDKQINDIKTKLEAKAGGNFTDVIKKLSGLNIDNAKLRASEKVEGITSKLKSDVESIGVISEQSAKAVTSHLNSAKNVVEDLKETLDILVGETDKDLNNQISGAHSAISTSTEALETMLLQRAKAYGLLAQAVQDADDWLNAQINVMGDIAKQATGTADLWLKRFETELHELQNGMPALIKTEFTAQIITPAIDKLFAETNWDAISGDIAALELIIQELPVEVEAKLDGLQQFSGEAIGTATELCSMLAGKKDELASEAKRYLDQLVNDAEGLADKLQEGLPTIPQDKIDYINDLYKATDKVLGSAKEISLEIFQAGEHAKAYLNRGAGIIDKVYDAKASELPGLALQLVSAATQSPEIAAFKTNADRVRLVFDEAKDAINSSKLKGKLDQLGDALKSLGLDFDFSQFSDTFKINLPEGDNLLRRLVPSFGGIDISSLMPSASLPDDLKDVVKITHDLDEKAGRAWVRVDMDMELPGREPMFSIGPFTLYLTRSFLTAYLRAEASKDQKEASVVDRAELRTTLEAVVGGQVMVTLKDVKITYSSADKLDFDIDPSKIMIHQSLRFIQDTLGSLFGDNAGGLTFIKEHGIPVGVEHQFALPSISIMAGTSGIQFLKISNRFSLRAYPDFVIANRFNLSRRNVPFLFSIFIIGGTGYIQVDTEYQPFENALTVVVEAGAGGSASLAFAFGPVTGGVYITLSIVLRYQKRIGNGASADDGLSVSLVLVIGGAVSLWGLVTVQLSISLAISYHDSGKMDGLGQLSVTVRISKWFKLRYSTQVKYTLRNGQSTRQVSSQTDVSGKAVDALTKLKNLDSVRKSL